MTESLYRITLSYLRENYHLINFTKLNYQARKDMFKIIENHSHLRKACVYRKIYNWKAIYSYMVKYYPTSYYFTSIDMNLPIDTSKHKTYIDGIYMSYNSRIIDQVGNKIYYIKEYVKHAFKYKILCNEIIKNNPHLMNKKGEPNVYDIRFFVEFPGLVEWAVKQNYVSGELFIYRELVK